MHDTKFLTFRRESLVAVMCFTGALGFSPYFNAQPADPLLEHQ